MKKRLTQGENKILLQFERFVETDFFQDKVKEFRFEYGLPKKGIKPTKKDLKNIDNLFMIPEGLAKKDISFLKKINKDVGEIMDSFPMKNVYLHSLVKYYIIFNKLFFDNLRFIKESFSKSNMCKVSNEREIFDEFTLRDSKRGKFAFMGSKSYLEDKKKKLDIYPISIGVSPDSSQRDVVDFIKKNWSLINYYQSTYRKERDSFSLKNSRIKENEKIKKRNNFIYKNRNLPYKEIVTLVYKKFEEFLDEGHIGKIISLENKKRK